MEILISLALKLAPYAIGAITLVGVYLHIKNKGKAEVRKEVELEQAKQQIEINTRLQEAERQDQEIDRAAQKTIEERIKDLREKQATPPAAPDRFKF